METLIANGISWLSRQIPALALMLFIMICTVWVTVVITDFNHRLAETERLCNDINTRQLPEINTRITKLEASMNERFLRIELQLQTIITYIETKEGKKPAFP
ncbi:MAG TPA: hypothetical protein VF473_00310 [Cyclobacteriaceae bacterium]